MERASYTYGSWVASKAVQCAPKLLLQPAGQVFSQSVREPSKSLELRKNMTRVLVQCRAVESRVNLALLREVPSAVAGARGMAG